MRPKPGKLYKTIHPHILYDANGHNSYSFDVSIGEIIMFVERR